MFQINSFLNSITMYRLMMYYLIFLVICAIALSVLQIIPFNPISIALSAFYLTLACRVINEILAKIFKVGINIESSIITGLILSLILGPVNWIPPFGGMTGGISGMTSDLIFLTAVAALAMASKYFIAWKGKHIFNPAAFGVVASAVLLNQGASWWVGMQWMIVPTLIGGLLVLKKIRRWEMVTTFLLMEIATLTAFARNDVLSVLVSSPLLFFTLIMLVEPLTSPTTKKMQIIYGMVVAISGFLISRLLVDVYYGLELSLLIGNLFSYVVSGSFRQVMILKEKKQLTRDVISFIFEPTRKFQFKAGQFLEWTLSHTKSDSRGVRRFFTIASSPTEDFVMLASKFYDKPSTFKQTLHGLKPGLEIIASSLSGEFTLPEDTRKKLVFIAGGIGITPFRSMVKYMEDKGEKRDIILLFSNKTEADIVFKDIFEKAKNLGVKTVYLNTDKDGFIDEKLIREQVPDFKERTFYISGPEPMVEAFEKMLNGMGIEKGNVKRDYFPGYTETHQK